MIESNESKTRDIPIWLTALVLLLCIGGGSWMVHWFLTDKPRAVVVVPDDGRPTSKTGWRGPSGGTRGSNNNGAGGGQTARDLNLDGVRALSKTGFRAKTGNTVMNVTYSPSGAMNLTTQYLSLRTAEQAELAIIRMSIIQDSTWRETLKVSDDQIDKLRKVPPAVGMHVDPADKAKLTELWKAYHEAVPPAKAVAEKAVLAALDEVGKKNLEATKAEEVARAEAIRTALTPEQLKTYREAGANGAKPAVAPKAKPAAAVPVPAAATVTPAAAVKAGDVNAVFELNEGFRVTGTTAPDKPAAAATK